MKLRLSESFLYKVLWLHYLIFHTFFSQSSMIPPLQRGIVFGSGILALALHRYDRKQWAFACHKFLFLVLNIWPLAIDSRVTLALFESGVFLFAILGGRGFSSLRKPFRYLLSLTFIFAGFHKLNTIHFFSPGSCSRELALRLLEFPEEILRFIPYLVVSGEIFLGSWIHFRKKFPLVAFGAFCVLLSVLGFHQFSAILWVLAGPQILFSREAEDRHPWAIMVFAFSLNALLPFLGVKNGGSLNMYSNLVIEDGRTNHFLLPQAVPGNLSRNLVIVSTDHIYLKPGHVVPRKYLQTQIRYARGLGHTPKFVVKEGQELLDLTGNESQERFIESLDTWEYVLLTFSPIPRDPLTCQW